MNKVQEEDDEQKKKPDWFISSGGWLLQRVILLGRVDAMYECITYSQVEIHRVSREVRIRCRQVYTRNVDGLGLIL